VAQTFLSAGYGGSPAASSSEHGTGKSRESRRGDAVAGLENLRCENGVSGESETCAF